MKRPVEFRTSLVTQALGALDARDRAILTATLSELDLGDLRTEILTPSVEGIPECWDVCLAALFDGGIEVRHLSRIVRHRPSARLDLHAKVRRLNSGLGNEWRSREVTEKVKHIVAWSAITTLFFYAVIRLDGGRTHETLWRHPSFTIMEARIALDRLVHYGLEEQD